MTNTPATISFDGKKWELRFSYTKGHAVIGRRAVSASERAAYPLPGFAQRVGMDRNVVLDWYTNGMLPGFFFGGVIFIVPDYTAAGRLIDIPVYEPA